jgi:tetratricopeptide (TPR) repeat protein
VSLEKVGDFLSRRGQPGDGEKALENYQRSLEVCERLLEQNPQSAEAARDVSVSLEKVGDFLSRRGQAGDGEKALELQQRAVEIGMALFTSNRQSVFYGRTLAVSLFLAFQRAQGVGQEKKAIEYLSQCFAVLDDLVQGGATLDPEILNLHTQLTDIFSKD